jgi:predicted phosphoribosyltransferase
VDLTGRTALIVDDGIATGSTARAACEVARAQGVARIVLAAPVAPVEATTRLGDVADEVVCLWRPAGFGAVGQFYEDFAPTTDDEVAALLKESAWRTAATPARTGSRRSPGGDVAGMPADWSLP